MIRLLTCALMLFVLALPSAFAQSGNQPELRLRQGSSFEGFDYTYISPWMLKSMQQKDLTELQGIPVNKVQHIEILKTKINGNDTPFKSIINRLSDEMNLIGYNRDGDKGVKICVDSSVMKDSFGSPLTNPDGSEMEIVKRILVIQWGKKGAEHLVTYIVGTFTPQEVNSIFHF
ncbi:MAG: DUF4252 domain-containing protein [Muribaculaceae bacterium]|nr:DUF4252 domain-containing protein [Muribaculaceae bacterium]